MASVTEAAIAGFNEFLQDQQKTEGQARLTLVLFDDEYLIPYEGIPLQEAMPLDTTTFVPRGSTALLDAIGTTIDKLGAKLEAMPEPERPGQVIVAVFTDGYENASTSFTWQDVSRRILEQTNTYKWQFLFLGANQDAIATASRLNIHASHAANYTADGIGTQHSTKAMSRKMAAIRKSSGGHQLNIQESADLSASMSHIVADEDAKGRKEG